MKRIIIQILALTAILVAPYLCVGQTTPGGMKNAGGLVRILTVEEKGKKTVQDLNSLTIDKRSVQHIFYDGLGRPLQTIQLEASPSGNDIVQPTAYDILGREATKYLPFVSSEKNGSYQADAVGEQRGYTSSPQYSFYQNAANIAHDTKPFAVTVLETSPLSRPTMQGAPGEVWQTGANEQRPVIKMAYSVNVLDEVQDWVYEFNDNGTFGSIKYKGSYKVNTLTKTTVTDEHQNQTIEFKDLQGRVLVKKVQNGSIYLSTYYIYDEKGNLRTVVPPQGVSELPASLTVNYTLTSDFLNKWCYLYHYDGRGRLIEKKLPGAEAEYLIYNKYDQLVMKQTGVLRQTPENKYWEFYKYDQLGRMIISGVYLDPTKSTGAQMQAIVDGKTTLFETRSSANYNTQHGYTAAVFPEAALTGVSTLIVNYYDDYNFNSDASNVADVNYTNSGLSPEPVSFNRLKGKLTGTKDRILSNISNAMMLTAYFYDEYGRSIQVKSQNHLNGNDIATNSYDFAGKVLESMIAHSIPGKATNIHKVLNYDHAGRLILVKQKINPDMEWTNIAAHEYNELGQSISKKLHSTQGSAYLQKIDYQYNIRGWLTHINDAALSNAADNDLFGMELKYESGLLTGLTTAQFNGNIAEQIWNSRDPNTNAVKLPKSYGYTYDALNRLTNAKYVAKGSTGNWNDNLGAFNEEGITYELNGNIKTLTRYTPTGVNQRAAIDVLGYVYNGNQLTRVNEDATAAGGFINGANVDNEFKYDKSGNIARDDNKGLLFVHNHLNLVSDVIKGSSRIRYRYMSSGSKVQKEITEVNESGTTVTTYDYIGGFEYKNQVLQQIAHEEGRVLPNGLSFNYEYYLKDHLGNVRVSFDKNPTTGKARIRQEDHYYAFGMRMEGNFVGSPENKYLYNGKRLEDDLLASSSLNMYDYGARMYDPAIGRWHVVDPLAELGRRWSPYVYCFNNPMRFTDPDGMWPDGPIGDFFSGIGSTINGAYQGAKKLVTDPVGTVQGIGQAIQGVIDNPKGAAEAAGNYFLNNARIISEGSAKERGELVGENILAVVGEGAGKLLKTAKVADKVADVARVADKIEDAASTTTKLDGSFSISDWSGYPNAGNVPKPEGPFRLLEGTEYKTAREAANKANSAMHKADPSLSGQQIHEIQPVKFGGSPTNPANKIPLTRTEHAQYTIFWNNLMRNINN